MTDGANRSPKPGAMNANVELLMDQQDQELNGQEKENLTGEVMESLGEPADAIEQEAAEEHSKDANDPLYVQKRLKRAERNHQKELRAMQSQIADLSARLGNQSNSHAEPPMNPYLQNAPEGSDEERIARAVRAVREQDKLEEQKRLEAEKMTHISKSYQKLMDNLDKAGDKYEDFDDVVMKDEVPITAHIRDALMLIGDDQQADVLYKLAKNPDELARISKLHPLDQAREVVKLSHALMGGNGGIQNKASAHRPLGQVKSMPVVSSSVTDKTPVSEIRARMKAGKWKANHS